MIASSAITGADDAQIVLRAIVPLDHFSEKHGDDRLVLHDRVMANFAIKFSYFAQGKSAMRAVCAVWV
jgi:hypothetical protein